MGYNNYNSSNDRANYSKDTKEKIKLDFTNLGFTDKNGNIREELLTNEAYSIAQYLIKGDGLSNSQLRAFFNEIKAINNRLDDKKENFEKNILYDTYDKIKNRI